MKKLLFVLFVMVCIFGARANAQCQATITVNYTEAGSNNQDTFSYYVTCDGYLYYSLIDNGGGGDNYEDYVLFTSENGPETFSPIDTQYEGGGNITGCVYIGTTNQEFWVSHGCGYITGDDAYFGENWDVNVSFDNCGG